MHSRKAIKHRKAFTSDHRVYFGLRRIILNSPRGITQTSRRARKTRSPSATRPRPLAFRNKQFARLAEARGSSQACQVLIDGPRARPWQCAKMPGLRPRGEARLRVGKPATRLARPAANLVVYSGSIVYRRDYHRHCDHNRVANATAPNRHLNMPLMF